MHGLRGCATVCPSGALGYAYPQVRLGKRIKTLLTTYREAGGGDACLLFHNADGRDLIAQLGRKERTPGPDDPGGSIPRGRLGADLMLGAVALGAPSASWYSAEPKPRNIWRR